MAFRDCRTSEYDIGMRYYLTDVDGTGGRLKKEPEDFVVKEISSPPERSEGGRFSIANVTTVNWETNRLVRMLARSAGMSRERIGFAGTKDKRAVTTQLMSFECPPEQLSSVKLKDVLLSDVYQAKRGIEIGDLIGNSFEITVRDCSADKMNIELISHDIAKIGGFPNYFGVQRFGSARPITHIVGERIVRGDIEGAVNAYLTQTSEFETPEVTAARVMISDDLNEAIKIMPKTMSFERTMVEHLIKRPDDHSGAIASMPSNLQMMFVHAYQSYLFNVMLSERIRLGHPLDRPVTGDVVIPLDGNGIPMHERPTVVTERNLDLVSRQVERSKAYVSITLFGSESAFQEGVMGDIERSVIEKEILKKEDFIVPGLPYCSSKGSRREILCPIRGLDHDIREDHYVMKFSLPKGNYATCLMREFMKSDMQSY